MAGKMMFNWLFGAIGFIITFAFSSSSNLLTTSLIRSLIAFVVWFVIAFALRWVIGVLKEDPADSANQKGDQAHQAQDDNLGINVDLSTPDETDELNDLLKPQAAPQAESQASNSDFAPLNPPRLATSVDKNPEELVKAVRHLTEE
ncbi:hypothetical protein DCC85_08855 [Paenibacillus sp. CAA11]|uniref:hypothetical protein n=1 Tax=Paenibacillus sp. CAA11 TaxID=1532905 RepID=UPI000D3C2EC4|nr:hypothetical protein [Paenibacillus sp. CAA11]AWB44319.1 hypothetical protein DCC85_08855 [Paenibacillus sp. CAA11]